MTRHASAALTLAPSGPARLILSIAAAGARLGDESLGMSLNGHAVGVEEIIGDHGTRLHVADVTEGTVEISYEVALAGGADPAPAPAAALDAITYTRPSRYCESDALFTLAAAEFGDAAGFDLLDQVTSWVTAHLSYVSGASSPTDGAVATQLSRQGVCRDYAHLTAALLRARDLPARVVSVYAPGLAPMDFHAVVEALVDGRWWVVDTTGLAPRQSMLRIATGRDAADTAFLTTSGAAVHLVSMEVTATVDDLPRDDAADRVELP